eukprot:gene9163-11230_t
MGHVDSGKTSLAKVLSTKLSTAALDKSPVSQERGITLDLGFSSFKLNLLNSNTTSSNENNNNTEIQFTLVDCPGHASLIKTIIGGSQIIDMMFLVIDVMKGVQTQTAEVTSKLKKVFEKTLFKDSPIVPFSANPSSENGDPLDKPIGIDQLLDILLKYLTIPIRDDQGSFLFDFDHCFQIKGQGSVLTGTVLRGAIEIGDTIQIPQLNIEKKVKSMQMFHNSIKRAIKGDRVGICVTQLNSKLLERGLACTNNCVTQLSAAIVSLEKIRFYKQDIQSKSIFHVTVGHSTVTASVTFFSKQQQERQQIEKENETLQVKELSTIKTFNSLIEYEYQDRLSPTSNEYPLGTQFGLIQFEHPILCPMNNVLIGSKLDISLDTSTCRIAFAGYVLDSVDDQSKQSLHQKLKIFKTKFKQGIIERIHSEDTIIGKNLFKKDTDITSFRGMKVIFENGQIGILESLFGKTGKVKIVLSNSTTESLKSGDNFKLEFKRFIFDIEKKNKQ